MRTIDQLRHEVVSKFSGVPGVVITERGPFLSTGADRRFYPFDPQPSEIHIPDIITSLGRLARYNGHTSRFYTVAEHSVYLSELNELPTLYLQRWALIHDFSEAYLGDMIRPLKHVIPTFEVVEHAVMRAIAKRLDIAPGHPEGNPIPDKVEEADKRIFWNEKLFLKPEAGSWGAENPIPDLVIPSKELEPSQASARLEHRFKELFPDYPLDN